MKLALTRGCAVVLAFLVTLPCAGGTVFEVALEGDLGRMKALLAEGPELIRAVGENGKTALHYAAQGGHLELVELLLSMGAEVDPPNLAGETPLHYAAFMGHPEVVRALIGRDAEVSAVDIGDNTPLHHAAQSGVLESARLLVLAGAEVNAANFYGYRPLDMAARGDHPEMCEFLEAQGGTRIVVEDPEVVHLSGSVYRILFPFGEVSNIGLSVGDEGFLLVDTGFSERAVGKLEGALRDLGEGELRFIINTHLHPDHVAGNEVGGRSAVVIDYNNLEEMVAQGVLSRGAKPATGRNGRSFDTYYILSWNGEEVRLFPYPGLHTDADLIVHFARSGVVHMGDLLILQSFPSVTQKANEYLELLEMVVDIFPESTRFICGHGREGSAADVAEYHAMLSSAAEIIRAELAAGKAESEIRQGSSLAQFDEWGTFIPVLDSDYWLHAVAVSSAVGGE